MNKIAVETMMGFTEILMKDQKAAYDFIAQNGMDFSKEMLVDIVKELIYSIHYHNSGDDYSYILEDVGVELDEKYADVYDELYITK